jgi:hypothetical protein
VIGVKELPGEAFDETDDEEILAGRIVFADGPQRVEQKPC